MEKNGNSSNGLNVFLAFVVFASFFLFLLGGGSLTGYLTQGSTTSNVTISKYLAIAFGTNLSQGIQFGTVNTLPATNINASHNHDGVNSSTTYNIIVSTDSNSKVDFCIKANHGLQDPSLHVIGLGNETYSAYNKTNITYPRLSAETPMTTGYIKAQSNINVGNSSYWRFWLDIPASQPAGNYNNTVSFEGVVAGLAC